MGISLYGLTPATTYDALIKTGDNAPIDATLKPLSDGVGTNLPMEASTTGINFTGSLLQGGVAVPTAAQVAAKQDTLVSGTNIKTINGTSVLGSGNIVTPSTSPSGVAGAIQFSNGSAFASDAANLFWDDTNNRLGIGTNAPTATGHFKGAGTTSATSALLVQNNSGLTAFRVTNDAKSAFGGLGNNGYFGINRESDGGEMGSISTSGNGINIRGGASFINCNNNYSNTIGASQLSLGAMWGIRGSGSTSATTSLLVQNSAGTEALKVRDDGVTVCLSLSMLGEINTRVSSSNLDIYGQANGTAGFGTQIWGFTGSAWQETLKVVNNTNPSVIIGGTTYDASAKLKVDSTISGFLPPRMTTTQKNAISSPASGLVVYDTTTNKLCCYNGSTWNDLF